MEPSVVVVFVVVCVAWKHGIHGLDWDGPEGSGVPSKMTTSWQMSTHRTMVIELAFMTIERTERVWIANSASIKPTTTQIERVGRTDHSNFNVTCGFCACPHQVIRDV